MNIFFIYFICGSGKFISGKFISFLMWLEFYSYVVFIYMYIMLLVIWFYFKVWVDIVDVIFVILEKLLVFFLGLF